MAVWFTLYVTLTSCEKIPVTVVAIDSDNIQANVGETVYPKQNTDVTTKQIGVVEFSKTFPFFSSSISKYLLIVESSTVKATHKPSFNLQA